MMFKIKRWSSSRKPWRVVDGRTDGPAHAIMHDLVGIGDHLLPLPWNDQRRWAGERQ